MNNSEPLVINVACTGAIPTRVMSPHVPLSVDEIIADVAGCLDLGVQVFHLHARDAEGMQTGDSDIYGRLIESIRSLPGGREAVLCVSTSGRSGDDVDARARVLDLDGALKPDMASLTLSSLNFVDSASINSPATIRRLAARMQERGIKPELEVFDLGMANFMHVLINERLITSPFYINIFLGNVAGAQLNPLHFATLISELPEDSIITVGGLGKYQYGANILGILWADGVRVGLEDNLWFDHQRCKMASNITLVQRVLEHASALGRPLMQRSVLRHRLSLNVSMSDNLFGGK